MARTRTAQHVALYLRISSDPLDLRAGVDRQRTDCTKIAADRWPGVPVVEYIDNDVSAYSGKRRPAFEQMLDALERGELAGLVAWDVDRLMRQPRDLERLIDLADAKRFRGVVTASSDLDLTTGDGRLQARILVAVATKASDDTSRRVRRALADRKAKGHRHGRLQYGIASWEADVITPEPTQAARIATAARRLLAGETLYAVGKYLAEDPAAPQTHPGARTLLMNSRTLDPVVRADVCALLDSKERRPRASNQRTQWAAGLLRCGVCGNALRLQSDRQTWACKPSSCTGINIKAEEAVKQLAFEVAGMLRRAEAPAPAGPAVDVQERLDLLAAEMARGELTPSEWKAARAAVLAMTHEEERPTPLPSIIDDLADRWEDMDANAKHLAVSALWSAVYVAPLAKGARPRFDPARLLYAPQRGTKWGDVVVTDEERYSATQLREWIGTPMVPMALLATQITIS